MVVRIKNVRPTPEGRESEQLVGLCDAIERLLPAGAQFAIVVLFPEGGRGGVAIVGDDSQLISAMRQVLDSAADRPDPE